MSVFVRTKRGTARHRALRAEQLEYRCLLAGDAYEPNDVGADAYDLGTGSQSHAELSIHHDADIDWFAWTATTDGGVTIEIEFAHTQGNLDMALYTADGVLVAESHTSTDNERTDFLAVAGLKYLIHVFGRNAGAQTEYALTIDSSVPQSFAPGDANQDWRFDEQDIVHVLQAGKYGTGERAAWSDGDWNGDGRFNQLDIVAALSSGNYLRGPYNEAPDPAETEWRGESCSASVTLPDESATMVLVPANQRPRSLVVGSDRVYLLPTQLGRTLDPRDVEARWGDANLHFVTQGKIVATEPAEVDGTYWSFRNSGMQPGTYMLVLEFAGKLHLLWQIALVEKGGDLREPSTCYSVMPTTEISEWLDIDELAADRQVYVSDMEVDSSAGKVYVTLRVVRNIPTEQVSYQDWHFLYIAVRTDDGGWSAVRLPDLSDERSWADTAIDESGVLHVVRRIVTPLPRHELRHEQLGGDPLSLIERPEILHAENWGPWEPGASHNRPGLMNDLEIDQDGQPQSAVAKAPVKVYIFDVFSTCSTCVLGGNFSCV